MPYKDIILKASELGCTLLKNEPLKKYTTFKVGGECDILVKVNGTESLITLQQICLKQETPYIVIGKGSNLIVSDNGYSGCVFVMGSEFSDIQLIGKTEIACEAGTPLAKLCYFAYAHGLSGLEFAWGIPGTVGGAVYMNAGAYGGEISDVITACQFAERNGTLVDFSKNEMEFSYRHSAFTDSDRIILDAKFQLVLAERDCIRKRMDELMFSRKSKQPIEYPSAGSTFKRPEGSYASLLIEQCGLKGLTFGGAQVSKKHSGFIINTGNATCEDIKELVRQVQNVVMERSGYKLECEPRFIGR